MNNSNVPNMTDVRDVAQPTKPKKYVDVYASEKIIIGSGRMAEWQNLRVLYDARKARERAERLRDLIIAVVIFATFFAGWAMTILLTNCESKRFQILDFGFPIEELRLVDSQNFNRQSTEG